MSELVLVERAAGVCELRLNRPDKRNAITFAMYDAMEKAQLAHPGGAFDQDEFTLGCRIRLYAWDRKRAPRVLPWHPPRRARSSTARWRACPRVSGTRRGRRAEIDLAVGG